MASHSPRVPAPQGTGTPDLLWVWETLSGTLTGLDWSGPPLDEPRAGRKNSSQRDRGAKQTPY